MQPLADIKIYRQCRLAYEIIFRYTCMNEDGGEKQMTGDEVTIGHGCVNGRTRRPGKVRAVRSSHTICNAYDTKCNVLSVSDMGRCLDNLLASPFFRLASYSFFYLLSVLLYFGRFQSLSKIDLPLLFLFASSTTDFFFFSSSAQPRLSYSR